MNKNFKKNILLIAPYFYGYELEIRKALKSIGLNVTNYFFSGYRKKFLSYKNNEKKYLRKIKNEINLIVQNKIFDYLLVINNSVADYKLLNILSDKNKSIKKIIYLWDSYANLHWDDFENYISYFDYRYSFEQRDCIKFSKYSLKHRPNFYHPMIDNIGTVKNPIYDIVSVMSAQPERLRLINQLDKYYPELTIYFHIYLSTFKSFPAYLINHGVIIKPKYIKLYKLTIEQTIQLLNNSRSILDISANEQNGLPFRSFDAIGLKKKLITSNRNIFKYEFYHPDNILIIKPGEIDNIKEFLSIPYRPIEELVRLKYSISFWIKSILYNKDINYFKIT